MLCARKGFKVLKLVKVSVKASLNGIAYLDGHNLFLALAPKSKVRTS
jgi:hypothetical protein